MKYTDYDLSEEYRDRHGFNQGDLYFIKEALKTFVQQQTETIKEMEEQGKQSIVSPLFLQQLSNDLIWKVEAFLTKPDIFDEEE